MFSLLFINHHVLFNRNVIATRPQSTKTLARTNDSLLSLPAATAFCRLLFAATFPTTHRKNKWAFNGVCVCVCSPQHSQLPTGKINEHSMVCVCVCVSLCWVKLTICLVEMILWISSNKNLGNQTERWNWFKKTVKLVYEGRKEGRDKPEDLIGSLWLGVSPSSAAFFVYFSVRFLNVKREKEMMRQHKQNPFTNCSDFMANILEQLGYSL